MKRCVLFLLLALAAGRTDLRAASGDVDRPDASPMPPAFLSGPPAALLTNTDGFSAHLVMLSNKTPLVSGELQGRDSKLLFVPEAGGSSGKRFRAGGICYLWDVASNSGYLISEALQGYAPASSSVRVTNLTAGAPAGKVPAEKIEGHRCERQEAIVSSSDGSATAFQVWRATDLKGFPARIQASARTGPLTVNLSKIRLVHMPAELFLPPDSFTRYDSAEAMLNELAARQQTLKRSPSSRRIEMEDTTGDAGDPWRRRSKGGP